MSKAPRELQAEIRDRASDIASDIATGAARRAARSNRQLAAVAHTFKAKRDRIPVVTAASGARAVTSSGAKAHEIFWGAEFGSDRLRRFPNQVKGGRSLFPTIKDEGPDAAERYFDAVREVFHR